MFPTDNAASSSRLKSFTVLKLTQDGLDWVTWKMQTIAMLASNKGVMRHLNGMIRIPNKILTYLDSHIISEDEQDALEKAEKCWDKYHQHEAQIMAQVFTMILESLLIEVVGLSKNRCC